MASRTWLAVLICIFIWFGYVQYFAPPMPAPQKSAQTPAAAPDTKAPTTAGATTPALEVSRVARAAGTTHTINNGRISLTFDSAGGRISEIAVDGYRETIAKSSPPIRPVKKEDYPLTLGTIFTDEKLRGFTNANYEGRARPSGYIFTHETKVARLEKNYDVASGSYFLDATYKIEFRDATRRDWGYLLIPLGGEDLHFDTNIPLQSWELLSYQNDSLTRTLSDKLSEGEQVLQGTTSWMGFGNRYFTTVLVNQSPLNPDVVLVNKDRFRGAYLRYPLQLKEGQKELTLATKIYSGPKDYAELSKVQGMRQILDYGMFSFLAYPLLELLRFFYKLIPNYGVAIILLTLVVRLLFYPLSVKSARSMKAMQKLQPQIQALKERYKEDMQRFNQEQMALFKAHNVNPLGGCFPMLIQLPVFFALYAVLGNSIELFHAPFFGWVQDLSSKDPWYVFPVLMGGSMFLQQRMTPMAGMEPAQQKMMMLMPIVFTFIMLNLPSGLTVYIFLSTMLGILQQFLINRESKGVPSAVSVAPSATPPPRSR